MTLLDYFKFVCLFVLGFYSPVNNEVMLRRSVDKAKAEDLISILKQNPFFFTISNIKI